MKKNFNASHELYEDIYIPSGKERKVKIKPFLFRIGMKIFIESNKNLSLDELFDYYRFDKAILTGEYKNKF